MKKINFSIKIVIPVVSIFFLFSCTDMLDVKSISTITNASMWKSEDDVNGGVTGMYVQLRGATSRNYHYAGELRSEIFGPGIMGPETPYVYLYNQTLSADIPVITWQSFYSVVNAANLVIKNAPGLSFQSESNKNKALAQAYTMRAFIYFVMTRTWGDLIIHTDPVESSSSDVIYRVRSSQADVFKLIKEDLDLAIQLFPDNNYPSGRCFWSKPAANALKADVYLWTGKKMNGGDADFTVALQALNEVVNTDVALLPEYGDIFKYDNKGNREIVMACRYQEIEAGDNIGWSMWIHPPSVPADIDDEAREIIFPVNSQGQFTPTAVYRDQYEPDDTRKNGSMYDLYSNNEYYTSVVLKFAGMVSGGTRYHINDIIFYRYADILLMVAEAKNALRQDPSAEINLVRERAYKENYSNHIYSNDTQAMNDEVILKERLLELAMEGKRWWDLVRFDKAFDLVPALQDKRGQNHYLLFPIGTSVLSMEPNITQNAGW